MNSTVPDSLETMILAYLPKNRIKPPKPDIQSDRKTMIPDFMYDISEIDISVGVRHCGSSEAYLDTVKTYLDTAAGNADEIERFWNSGDLRHTIVKVHAVKSTSRIIAAEKLGAFAEMLEKAGNAGDTRPIGENIGQFLSDYRSLADKLSPLGAESPQEEMLPFISDEKLKEAYSAIRGFPRSSIMTVSIMLLTVFQDTVCRRGKCSALKS